MNLKSNLSMRHVLSISIHGFCELFKMVNKLAVKIHLFLNAKVQFNLIGEMAQDDMNMYKLEQVAQKNNKLLIQTNVLFLS